MDIRRDSEIPAPPQVESWRETAWDHLAFGLTMAILAIVAAIFPFVWAASASIVIAIACLIAALLFAALSRYALQRFFATRDPRYWLVRWSPEGLALRYRAGRDRRDAADPPIALVLMRDEIAWIRKWTEITPVPGLRGERHDRKRRTGIEIGLTGTAPQPVADVLNATRGPVTLTDDGTLRLTMRRPEPLLGRLSQDYPVGPNTP